MNAGVRSVLAVFAGLVAVVALSLGTDEGLIAAGIFPSFDKPNAFTTGMLLAATAYRSAYAVLGSFIAARLAPSRPMTHALALGVLGFGLATAGAVMMQGVGPAWYPIALVATALPCAWLGGILAR